MSDNITESALTKGLHDDPLPLKGRLDFIKTDQGRYGVYVRSSQVIDGKIKHDKVYLGKLIREDIGLYHSNKRGGYFTFSIENGIREFFAPNISPHPPMRHETILHFGDVWMIDQVSKQVGLSKVMESFCPDHSDTLKALVAFKLTNPSKSWREAENWYQWSFAKILYPKATVSSGRISEFHAHIGNENYYQSFFTSYLQMISSNKNIFGKISVGTLIDSTSLDNYIKTHLTAISNHNEVVKNEIRLIYILDRESKLPLYFRYVPANTIDNSILTTTINELRAFGIDVDLIIMDAGYCSKQNIEQLSKQNINFITRMTRNRKEYKSLMSEHGNDMQQPENAIRYHERFLFGKKVPITLYGAELNAYIMLDLNEYTKDMQNGTANYLEVKDDPLAIQKAHDSYFSAGKFILLSSNDYSIDEILPMYYTRQAIEQVFDIAKTYIGDTPLRVHSEDTLRGVLLIAFIATALNSSLSRGLYGSKYSTNTALSLLHNAIIKIFESMISVNELTKQQREIFSQLNIECPYTVLEKNNPLQKSPLLPSVEKEKGNRGRPKGSKNKPKHTFAADIESKQIMTSERQRGRPKGSKNKAKQANGPETNQNIGERRQRGRPKGSKNKAKQANGLETSQNIEERRQRGRSKGSKNKVK